MKFCSILCLLLLPLVSLASSTAGTLDKDDGATLWLTASTTKYKLDFQGDNDARQAAKKHVGKAVTVTGRVAEKEDHWTIFVTSIAIKKDCGCELTGECACTDCKCGMKTGAAKYKRYHAAAAELTEGDVLITFIACLPCPCPDGCKVCRTEKLEGFPSGAAVISVREGGKHLWHSTVSDPKPEKIQKPAKFMCCDGQRCTRSFFPPQTVGASYSGAYGTPFDQGFPTFAPGPFGGGCAGGNCGAPMMFMGGGSCSSCR